MLIFNSLCSAWERTYSNDTCWELIVSFRSHPSWVLFITPRRAVRWSVDWHVDFETWTSLRVLLATTRDGNRTEISRLCCLVEMTCDKAFLKTGPHIGGFWWMFAPIIHQRQ